MRRLLKAVVAIFLSVSQLIVPVTVFADGPVTLSGIVSDQSSSGISNVEVDLDSPGTNTVEYSTITGGDGSYSLVASPGTYDIVFTPPASTPYEKQTVSNYSLTADSVYNLVYTVTTNTISGHIATAGLSGVTLNQSLSQVNFLNTTTNAAVGGSLSGGNNYSISTSPESYNTAIASIYPLGGAGINLRDTVSVDATNGDTTQDFAVTLHKVSVHVEDVNGNPLPGALVTIGGTSSATQHTSFATSALTATGTQGQTQAYTDGSGDDSAIGVDNFQYDPVCVTFPGTNQQTCADPFTLTSEKNITFQQPVTTNTISGHIATTGLSGVTLNQSLSQINFLNTATNDAVGGNFSEGNNYSISTSPKSYDAAIASIYPLGAAGINLRDTVSVDATNGNTTQDFMVTLRKISVHVKDANGNPLTGALVTIGGTSNTTQHTSFATSDSTATGTQGQTQAYTDSNGDNSSIGVDNFQYDPVCVTFPGTNQQVCSDAFTLTEDKNFTFQQPVTSKTISGHIAVAGLSGVTLNQSLSQMNFVNTANSAAVGGNLFGGNNYSISTSPEQYDAAIASIYPSGGAGINLRDTVSVDAIDYDVTQNFTVTLHKISVHVEDMNGNSISGALVTIGGTYNTTQHTSFATSALTATGTQGQAQAYTDGSGDDSSIGVDNFQYDPVCVTFPATNQQVCSDPFTLTSDKSITFRQAPLLPAAPISLSATSPTNQKPVLNWTQGSGGAAPTVSYRIYRNGSSVGTSSTTTFTDSALTANGTYSYKVTAVAANGAESAPSNTVTVVYDTTPPTASSPAISGLLGTIVTPLLPVAITANASDSLSGVVSGEFYIDTDPGQGHGTTMSYANGNVTASSTINLGLAVGSHTIYIRAKDAAGNWSAPVSVTFTYL